MAVLDEILAANREFLAQASLLHVGRLPSRRTAIITCVDTRLVGLLEQALGIKRGDVIEIRVAGATLPEGEALESDVVRGLLGVIYLLGVREILVIGHLHCGISHVSGRAIASSMRAAGVDPMAIEAYRLGGEHSLAQWLGGFDEVHTNVRRVAHQLRTHPYIAPSIHIHALVIDPDTGELELVERGDSILREL